MARENKLDVCKSNVARLFSIHLLPAADHYGLAPGKWQRRAEVLRAAHQAHPERFPRGMPVPPPLPTAAWINKPLATPVLAVPEGILRAQAQRDRLQEQAAYPTGTIVTNERRRVKRGGGDRDERSNDKSRACRVQ
jgi:hypothetical protein